MRRAKATTSDFIVTSYSPRQENTALRPYLPRFVHTIFSISSRAQRELSTPPDTPSGYSFRRNNSLTKFKAVAKPIATIVSFKFDQSPTQELYAFVPAHDIGCVP